MCLTFCKNVFALCLFLCFAHTHTELSSNLASDQTYNWPNISSEASSSHPRPVCVTLLVFLVSGLSSVIGSGYIIWYVVPLVLKFFSSRRIQKFKRLACSTLSCLFSLENVHTNRKKKSRNNKNTRLDAKASPGLGTHEVLRLLGSFSSKMNGLT